MLKKVNSLKEGLKKENLLKEALKKALKKVNLLKKGLKKEQPVKKVNSRKCIHSKKYTQEELQKLSETLKKCVFSKKC